MSQNYNIYSLSDSALTIDFGNVIDEEINNLVTRFFNSCNQSPFKGFIEAVPAYSSLTIFYNVYQVRLANPTSVTAFEVVKSYLEEILQNLTQTILEQPSLIEIPVIYDGEDLGFVADYHHLSVEQIIEIHTTPTYRVYMMGFLPGFAYLGGLDERIATPRKSSPRTKVPAGSVGIGGNQTGVYPLESPGGWQLIGRTTLQLFTLDENLPTLLKAGDLVKFKAI